MASPLTVRQPLAQRPVNTAFYPITTTTTVATTANATRTAVLKPIAVQKRLHSQISNGQENVQQQILSTATSSKSPQPAHQKLAQPIQQGRTLTNVKLVTQLQSQFKQPLTKPVVPRQRHQNHDPGVQVIEDREMIEWRKCMRRTISNSTFYLDGLEEPIKDQATHWLNRHGGVSLPQSVGF